MVCRCRRARAPTRDQRCRRRYHALAQRPRRARHDRLGTNRTQHRAIVRPGRWTQARRAPRPDVLLPRFRRRPRRRAALRRPGRAGTRPVRLARTILPADRIDRFVPTSQRCSTCGAVDGPKPLSVRRWTCVGCDIVHGRDQNAALNILAAGRAERSNACGGDVRPGAIQADPAEAGTHRRDAA